MKTALVIGVSGQDGAYLAESLLEKGYKVCGTSRDAHVASFRNLERLKIWEESGFEACLDGQDIKRMMSLG